MGVIVVEIRVVEVVILVDLGNFEFDIKVQILKDFYLLGK